VEYFQIKPRKLGIRMKWRGFLKESKSYINYPKCGRFYFWFNFPRAWWRFYKLTKGDK